jgi:TRAP-type C4-dicarboxylate transport system substrate-binding protein
MLVDAFKAVGFEPVPMAFPKVYGALLAGEIDGQENPLPTILSSHFYNVQKYLTLSRHVYSAFVLLISKKTWDGMTPADQKLVQKAALEARDYQRRLNRQETQKALEALKAAGMKVSSIPRDEMEYTRARLRPVLEKYNDSIGASQVIRLYIELGRLRTVAQ